MAVKRLVKLFSVMQRQDNHIFSPWAMTASVFRCTARKKYLSCSSGTTLKNIFAVRAWAFKRNYLSCGHFQKCIEWIYHAGILFYSKRN